MLFPGISSQHLDPGGFGWWRVGTVCGGCLLSQPYYLWSLEPWGSLGIDWAWEKNFSRPHSLPRSLMQGKLLNPRVPEGNRNSLLFPWYVLSFSVKWLHFSSAEPCSLGSRDLIIDTVDRQPSFLGLKATPGIWRRWWGWPCRTRGESGSPIYKACPLGLCAISPGQGFILICRVYY